MPSVTSDGISSLSFHCSMTKPKLAENRPFMSLWAPALVSPWIKTWSRGGFNKTSKGAVGVVNLWVGIMKH